MSSIPDAKRQTLERAIGALPRVRLSELPTPLEPAARLTESSGIANLLIKRDDQLGLALGGNKVRMFEFVLGSAGAEDVDSVLCGAPLPANYCRQLAGACARLGLECRLVFGSRPESARLAEHDQLMLRLAQLFGAQTTVVSGEPARLAEELERTYAELQAQGKRVLALHRANPAGTGLKTEHFGLHAVAYCNMFIELLDQINACEWEVDELWLCSSEATQAGIALANEYLGRPMDICGVSPAGAPTADGWSADIATIANEAADTLGLDLKLDASDITSIVGSQTEAEGQVTLESVQAVNTVATREGIAIDPVYTGKAMAALLARIRDADQRTRQQLRVVFLHTGGTPAIFSYIDEILHSNHGGAEIDKPPPFVRPSVDD